MRYAAMFLFVAALASCDGGCSTFGPSVEVLRNSASLGGVGFSDSFTVSCPSAIHVDGGVAQDPQRIRAPGGMIGYECVNESAVPVYVGDNDMTNAARGPAFCTSSSTCPSGAIFGGAVRHEYCLNRADAGSTTIYCRGLVASEP